MVKSLLVPLLLHRPAFWENRKLFFFFFFSCCVLQSLCRAEVLSGVQADLVLVVTEAGVPSCYMCVAPRWGNFSPCPQKTNPESTSVARAVALLLGIALQSAGSRITPWGAGRYHGPPSTNLVEKRREGASFPFMKISSCCIFNRVYLKLFLYRKETVAWGC